VITLSVIADRMLSETPSGVGRYTEELTRALVATAPDGCQVEAIIGSHGQDAPHRLRERIAGLSGVHASPLTTSQLELVWRLGRGAGSKASLLHAPTPFAPLRDHDRSDGRQAAVTIHDLAPWRHPDSLPRGRAALLRSMAKRAERYADALVVPTHAVAEGLAEFLDFGDRVRVIGGAVASTLVVPRYPDVEADRLGLPQDFLLTVATPEPRKGLRPLLESLILPGAPDLPLVVVGAETWGETSIDTLIAEVGVPPSRVRAIGVLDDRSLALALSRARAFVYPSLDEGFPLPVVEAFHFGTPVVHSDSPAILEVSAGAGVVVGREPAADYAARLAEALGRVLGDSALLDRLAVLSRDRARAFSWHDSAERVWQLHADL